MTEPTLDTLMQRLDRVERQNRHPVLVHYMFKTGGVRGTALGAAMTERFFCDLVECGAEAVVP